MKNLEGGCIKTRALFLCRAQQKISMRAQTDLDVD
jgi:hypothetical protein